ncbi:MAG: FHA domain-containing protein [Planctomycetes bacterium]|nr:FHA domain-containing protein [Planctomycetota bacterium]
MPIKFACPECSSAYKVPEKYAGKRIRCKKCEAKIRVPSETVASLPSQRTQAVSKRNVLDSKRLSGGGSSSKRSSSTSSKSSASGRSSRTSGRSGRTSTRSATSARSSASSGGRSKTGTQRFEPVDLFSGNKAKKFQRKKEREEPLPTGEGRLTFFEDEKPRKNFKVGSKGALIGRGGKSTIKLPSESVSSEHMRLEFKLGSFIATDLRSTNGLKVNGKVVRRTSLKDGDIIQLGEAVLRLDC